MKTYLYTPLMIALMVAGCAKKEAGAPEQAVPVVCAVNYPLAFFAETLAGEATEVVFPAMEGDPAFWNPTPEQIAEFQQADLILLNGASYAKWVPHASLPQARLVDTSAAFRDEFIAVKDAVTHSHGPEGAHAHGNTAFTTWLDPRLAVRQLAAVRDALSDRGIDTAAGMPQLEAQLAELDNQLEQAFAPFGQDPLLGSHPVYQYLTRRYGLNLRSVHWEPDAVPDDAMLAELDDLLKSHPAAIMLWEDQPLEETAALLKDRGIASVVFNPCGNRPETGDFLQVMSANVNALEDYTKSGR